MRRTTKCSFPESVFKLRDRSPGAFSEKSKNLQQRGLTFRRISRIMHRTQKRRKRPCAICFKTHRSSPRAAYFVPRTFCFRAEELFPLVIVFPVPQMLFLLIFIRLSYFPVSLMCMYIFVNRDFLIKRRSGPARLPRPTAASPTSRPCRISTPCRTAPPRWPCSARSSKKTR